MVFGKFVCGFAGLVSLSCVVLLGFGAFEDPVEKTLWLMTSFIIFAVGLGIMGISHELRDLAKKRTQPTSSAERVSS